MMSSTPSPSFALPEPRLQLVSSTGLALLFAALVVAEVQAILPHTYAIAGGVSLALTGGAIAWMQRWPILAAAGLAGELVVLSIAASWEAPALALLGGLAAVILMSVVLGTRKGWAWLPCAVTVAVACLTAAWVLGSHLPRTALVQVGVLLWLPNTASAMVTSRGPGDSRGTQVAAAAGSAAGLGLALLLPDLLPTFLVTGALFSIEGLLLGRWLRGRGRFLGEAHLHAGIGLLALGAWVQFEGVGLSLGLAGLSLATLRARPMAPWREGASLSALYLALAVLGLFHPIFGARLALTPVLWGCSALLLSIQAIGMALWLTSHEGAPAVTPLRWLREGLSIAASVAVLSSTSTLLSAFTDYVPTLTIFWAVSAGVLWHLGHRSRPLRALAPCVLVAAVIKFVAVDWVLLNGLSRVLLLALLGSVLLIAPLLRSSRRVEPILRQRGAVGAQ